MECNGDCKNCQNPICKEFFYPEKQKKKKNKRNPRTGNKYERNKKYKTKIMRKLDYNRADITQNGSEREVRYSSYYPAMYTSPWKSDGNQKPHLYFWSYNDKFLKNYSNRIVRRYKRKILNGCMYKKIFEYKWKIM